MILMTLSGILLLIFLSCWVVVSPRSFGAVVLAGTGWWLISTGEYVGVMMGIGEFWLAYRLLQ